MAQSQSTLTRRVHIAIHGIGYGPAVQRIEQELARVRGVSTATLSPSSGKADVGCDASTQPAELLATLRRLGFRAELLPT